LTRRITDDAPDSHSFIVKIWIEDAAEADHPPTWRGYITHVPDGEQRYVQSLAEIEAILASYLSSMGIESGWRTRLRLWLGRSMTGRRRE
jgi:hypothetical protein